MTVEIARPNDLSVAREIIREYGLATGLDLTSHTVIEELKHLPSVYEAILVATEDGATAGAGMLRRIDETACEMKRLYVRPAFRGRGIGEALILRLIDEARRLGFMTMRLDTLPNMTAAIALYRSFGFRDIAPYHDHGDRDSVYMELDLSRDIHEP